MGLAQDAIRISGLTEARNWLRQAPDLYEAAQRELRAAQAAEREVRDEYDQAVLDAEWELDSRFVVEGNKTYLMLHDGSRKAMTADERKSWKSSQALTLPAVAKCLAALRRAEERVASARDAVVLADKRLSAQKLEVEAAISTLNALVVGLEARQLAQKENGQ